MTRRWALATLAMIGIAGCFASRDTGRPFASVERRKLTVNWTTRREAQRLLGPPLASAASAEGWEEWTYEYTKISARGLAPFERTTMIRQAPYERLVLTFQYGVLSECAYVAERYRTEHGVIVPAETLRERCAE